MTIAAFFDLDSTLIPAPSIEKRYLSYLRWHGDLRWRGWLRAAAHMLPLAVRANRSWETRDAGEAEWSVLVANNKAYLAGVPCWTMRAFAAWIARYPITLFPGARRRIHWHIEQGHRVFLVSGTPAPLAQAIAREIHRAVEVLATELVSVGGRFTGAINGAAMCGIEKARAIARLGAERRLHLQDCFGYGDSLADRWMLSRVGHPVAVNSSRALDRLARENGWPIARWVPQPDRSPAARTAERAPDAAFVARLCDTARRNGLVVTALSATEQDTVSEKGANVIACSGQL